MQINATHYQLTFKQLVVLFFVLFLSSCDSPSPRHSIIAPVKISKENIITNRNIPETHKIFLARFLPEIHRANNMLLEQRNSIFDLQDSLDANDKLSSANISELNKLLRRFRLDPLSTTPPPLPEDMNKSMEALLKRADIIPVKLVMAQAIIESGWGSSHFALEGNNYFGIHCYSKGCGMMPAGIDSATFFVKSYDSEIDGIIDYLRNLNTGRAYRELREIRLDLRNKDKDLDPLALAEGLASYSEIGDAYIKMISNIIRNYIPANTEELLSGKFEENQSIRMSASPGSGVSAL
ncbi:MAG: glucosaminidase domain-containing protein [Bacteroidota bacterium]